MMHGQMNINVKFSSLCLPFLLHVKILEQLNGVSWNFTQMKFYPNVLKQIQFWLNLDRKLQTRRMKKYEFYEGLSRSTRAEFGKHFSDSKMLQDAILSLGVFPKIYDFRDTI